MRRAESPRLVSVIRSAGAASTPAPPPSRPARAESSSGDREEAFPSRVAAAASSCMGLRVRLMVPAFLNRLHNRLTNWQISSTRPAKTAKVIWCSRSRVMA